MLWMIHTTSLELQLCQNGLILLRVTLGRSAADEAEDALAPAQQAYEICKDASARMPQLPFACEDGLSNGFQDFF